MIGSYELLTACLKLKDESYLQSMIDHLDLWHLIFLSQDYPETKSKIEWIFDHGKHMETVYTYSMFRFMMQHPLSKRAIPLFLERVFQIENELAIVCFLLYMNSHEEEKYVYELINRFNQRHNIRDLWINHRFDLLKIRHPYVIHYLGQLLKGLIQDSVSIHHYYFQYNYLIILLNKYPIYDTRLRSIFCQCYFYFSVNICSFLIHRYRMKEVMWILHYFPLPSILYLRLLEESFSLSTDRPFFQLLSFLPSISLKKIRPFKTHHDSICHYLVQQISNKEDFEECFIEAFANDQLNCIQHLYQHFPKWFQSCWKIFGNQFTMQLMSYDIFMFLTNISSIDIHLTTELFFHFLFHVHGSRISMIQDMKDRYPTSEIQLKTDLIYQLEYWTLQELQYLINIYSITESVFKSLFLFYVDRGKYPHIRWLYETFKCLESQSLYSIPCLYSMIETNHLDGIKWMLSLSFSEYQRFHLIDKGMAFACQRGWTQSMIYFHSLYPTRFLCKSHEIEISSGYIPFESFLLDINVFCSNPISLSSPIECGICYESYGELIHTNCLHSFCMECLRSWFLTSQSMNCPICRQLIYLCYPIIEYKN